MSFPLGMAYVRGRLLLVSGRVTSLHSDACASISHEISFDTRYELSLDKMHAAATGQGPNTKQKSKQHPSIHHTDVY